ncbi:hypothetical protein SCHPADRAFT_1002106 [Schizopora paradoxa]|uniref:BTB domain-containing protein n=1 Tax=Schizopora paradoxa TaxID=27342 RepID=A0A0H2RPR3_9AGAM|nr:hypothetical protein SCHPADRAFT_1002106 [Schizopora paradoxa]
MAHRSKRARSESGDNSRDLGSQGDPIAELQRRFGGSTPHESFWFDDASIVLQTDVHLYRVHKSTLAKYSSVFRDMLEMPSGGGGNGNAGGGGVDEDRWDGLPLVRMAGDDNRDVYHLLMTLYDRDFYNGRSRATVEIMSSLLLMSTKYDIPSIRKQVIEELEKYYPHDIGKAFGTTETWPERFGDVPDEVDFLFLAVVLRCNVRRLLPMILYQCAVESMPFILESSDIIDKETLHKILIGRERLVEMTYDIGFLLLFPSEGCESENCFQARRTLCEVFTRSRGIHSGVFPISAIKYSLKSKSKNHEAFRSACNTCALKSSRAREQFKTKFWDELPEIFGLGTWAELLNDE